jgi:hypothetical protein
VSGNGQRIVSGWSAWLRRHRCNEGCSGKRSGPNANNTAPGSGRHSQLACSRHDRDRFRYRIAIRCFGRRRRRPRRPRLCGGAIETTCRSQSLHSNSRLSHARLQVAPWPPHPYARSARPVRRCRGALTDSGISACRGLAIVAAAGRVIAIGAAPVRKRTFADTPANLVRKIALQIVDMGENNGRPFRTEIPSMPRTFAYVSVSIGSARTPRRPSTWSILARKCETKHCCKQSCYATWCQNQRRSERQIAPAMPEDKDTS